MSYATVVGRLAKLSGEHPLRRRRPRLQRGNVLLAPGAGMTPIDLSDPTAPVTGTHVSFTFTPAPFGLEEVAVDGTHAYVVSTCNQSAGTHCTQVLDISDPMNPVVVGSSIDDVRVHADLYPLLTPPDDWSLRVQEGTLTLSNFWGGELVMDVSDPTHPRRVNEYWTTYPAHLTYQFDRYLLAHLTTSTGNAEQVIDMCP